MSSLDMDAIQSYRIQGVRRIYGRFCNYKAIKLKVNNQALHFVTFYNQDYLEMLIQKKKKMMKGIAIIGNHLPGLQLQFYPQHFSDTYIIHS